MAKAPRPGMSKRAEAADSAKKVMRLTIRGESRTLAIGSIPFKERQIVRKATGGLPIEAYLGEETFGIDSLMICWWLAGRAAGDPFLTLTTVTDDPIWDGLTEDDIEVEVEDPDDEADDPEA